MATVFGTGAAKRSARGGGSSRATSSRIQQGSHRPGAPPRDGPRPGSSPPLNTLISEQIIPRLLMTHSRTVQRPGAAGGLAVNPVEAARFAALPLQLEADELLTVVETFINRGVSVDSVFVDLLAPAARELGRHWEEDECDFLDVTMGLWRLQEVMREITMRYPPVAATGTRGRCALFAPMPGEDHSLGALMVEEVFARAGWATEVLIEPKRKELLQIIASRHFDVVGLTLSCDWPIATVADLISAMRSVSKSPDLKVLIGGRMVNASPALATEVGADGTAPDARSALALAEQFVAAASRLDRTGA